MELLKGKKAVVTGGTSGIGRAIAALFVQNGADVVIIGTNVEKAKEAIREIEKEKKNASQRVFYKILDVSKTLGVEKVFKEILEEFKTIDVLVNSAGITRDGFLMRMSEENWDRVIDVNLKSIFNTCKVVSRYMMKQKKGKIINISSVTGLIGNIGQTNYAASKSGMIGFSKSLAKELAAKGINVNCIAPGFIETKMTEVLKEEIKEEILKKIPMKCFGKAKDVANVALFLATEFSDYITGQCITVSGGMVM
jgi:3-oxoacyl-[acyl-carrier protein] reductase